jgi:hypothetical protein
MLSKRRCATAIVADGHERDRRAHEPLVRAQVEQEYAHRLHATPLWRRWLVRRALEQEVERRLDLVAPPEALY